MIAIPVVLLAVVAVIAAFTLLPWWAGLVVTAAVIAGLTTAPGVMRRRRVMGLDSHPVLYDPNNDPALTGAKLAPPPDTAHIPHP